MEEIAKLLLSWCKEVGECHGLLVVDFRFDYRFHVPGVATLKPWAVRIWFVGCPFHNWMVSPLVNQVCWWNEASTKTFQPSSIMVQWETPAGGWLLVYIHICLFFGGDLCIKHQKNWTINRMRIKNVRRWLIDYGEFYCYPIPSGSSSSMKWEIPSKPSSSFWTLGMETLQLWPFTSYRYL